MSFNDAVNTYRPFAPGADDEPRSDLELVLRKTGIAEVSLSVPANAFQQHSEMYATCIEEFPELLIETQGSFDSDGVPEDGHVYKELEIKRGKQVKDPKNLFHFNNTLREKWAHSLHNRPSEFREFMETGFDLQAALVASAQNLVTILDESYKKMSDLYFPSQLSNTTYRLLRYDGYQNSERTSAQVAKPHFDKGGMTIQAYASDPGFWFKQPDAMRNTDEKQYPPHGVGQSQVFFGEGHFKIYGEDDHLKRLYHGVDRLSPTENPYVGPRTAAILFVDAYGISIPMSPKDTLPEIANI